MGILSSWSGSEVDRGRHEDLERCSTVCYSDQLGTEEDGDVPRVPESGVKTFVPTIA